MKNKIILTTLSPKTHRTSEENLGIEYLKSSLLKSGYDVEIIDGWLNELSIDEIYYKIISQRKELLFIGISSYMSNTEPTINLINMIKNNDNNIKIVCGGFGPTFYPKEYLESGSDYIIRGEGERAICKLADAIQENQSIENINNIGYRKNGEVFLNEMDCLKDDLDSLPFPSRDTMDIIENKKSSVNIVTSRGCSGNCEFCSVISFFRLSDGKIWRTRSISNIVDEIELLYKQGVSLIKVVDDSFIDGNRDEEWCKLFADEIEKRNIKVKLRGQIRADKISDSILNDLRRAGFYSFACGIENFSQSALSRMNKKATTEDNKKALELFKKYNYLVQMGFILFDKYTTLDELEENLYFLEMYDFTLTKGIFSEMFSAEGTILNDKLRSQKEIKESNFIDNNNKYIINDEIVNKIYYALKMWHKSHSYIYDMTIDPLIAPKDISENDMLLFYKLSLKLKKLDLLFFRKILNAIKKNQDIDMEELLKNCIIDTSCFYNEIEQETKKLYYRCNLEYHAEKNPFI